MFEGKNEHEEDDPDYFHTPLIGDDLEDDGEDHVLNVLLRQDSNNEEVKQQEEEEDEDSETTVLSHAPLIEDSSSEDRDNFSATPYKYGPPPGSLSQSQFMINREIEMLKTLSQEQQPFSNQKKETITVGLKHISASAKNTLQGSVKRDVFADVVTEKLDLHNFIEGNSFLVKAKSDFTKQFHYFVSFLSIISLLLLAEGDVANETFLGLTLREWAKFLCVSFGTVASFTFIGHFFLKLLVTIYAYHADYGFTFIISSLLYPIVYMSSIICIANFNANIHLPLNIKTSDSLFVVIVWIILFTGTKNFYVNKYFLKVVQRRLDGKLKEIDNWQLILSVLSSEDRYVTFPVSLHKDNVFLRLLATFNVQRESIWKIVRYISRCGFGDDSSETDSDNGAGDEDDQDVVRQPIMQRSFWKRAHSVKKGAFKLSTTAGIVKLRNKKHVISFTRRLYLRLTNGVTRPLTSTIICDAFFDNVTTDISHTEMFMDAMMSHFQFTFDSKGVVAEVEVTQKKLISVVQQVFRTFKFAETSLSDNQALQQSVVMIVDAVFWLLMTIFAQIVLQIDTSDYLAPLLTILFGFSFAIAPIFSNLFLSLSFVLFLLPFDIGDRIIISKSSSNQLTGNVMSISLSYTVINSNQNEIVKIPNHTLFYERIINLSESKHITFIIHITFCLNGPSSCPQGKIDRFFTELKRYVTVEKKAEWKDIWVAISKIDPQNNQINYEIWMSHMACGDQVVTIYRSRDVLLEKIRALKDELGISSFMKTVQPVEVSHPMPADNNEDARMDGTETSMSVRGLIKEKIFPSSSSLSGHTEVK